MEIEKQALVLSGLTISVMHMKVLKTSGPNLENWKNLLLSLRRRKELTKKNFS